MRRVRLHGVIFQHPRAAGVPAEDAVKIPAIAIIAGDREAIQIAVPFRLAGNA
jgi:hypothetical protein